MFGYLIPRNYMEAMQFDSENKNSKWYDAIKLEMESMIEYEVFKSGIKQSNRKISTTIPLVSCCSCVNNPSSS